MDCNKEEASRAKKIAEEKMRAGDYVGAHKFATKAHTLFPNLENIQQMIAICDVHSSANRKIYGLDNWYGILQVQPFSDADTIKRQYRKLVLLLHPDKNKFSGAEAAFKVVGEANRWLSDRIKRSQYDVKYRSHILLSRKRVNANRGRHCAAVNNTVGNAASGYTFWTCCKNCGSRYKYLKLYINTVMHCSTCKKSYIASNMGDGGVPPSSSTACKKNNENNTRRSSRKKPEASYAEGGSDGDTVSPPKKKTKARSISESDSNTKQTAEENKSSKLADSGVSSASSHAYKRKTKKSVNSGNEDILPDKNKESEGCDGHVEDAAFSSKIDKVENGCKANANPNTHGIADPEFSLFEKNKVFAVNQVWSISDPRDGMPRKYALVKKVLNAEFKLRVTYLDPVQDKNDKSIPVACGKFKNGKTEEVMERSIFSAQMHHLFCNRFFFIYPRKGEIWAIFREWNEEWNTSLEKHKLPYKYDFVEVVSDFNYEDGLGVAYLGKLKGFVSRFHWEAQHGICQIQFTPKEILRFSHKIPAIKMTGKEKECIPADSYELERSALPKDILQVDAVDIEIDSEIRKGKADGSYPEAPNIEVKAKPVPKTTPSPRKCQKSDDGNGVCSNLGEARGGTSRSHNFSSSHNDEMNTLYKSSKRCEAADVVKLRKSPRLQTIPSQQSDEKKSFKQGNKMNTLKGFGTDASGIKRSPNGICQPPESREGESSKKRRCSVELPTQLDGSTNESPETTPVSTSCKTPRRNAFDFKNQRSEDKFQVNQIWAVYSNYKRMPSEYVMIKKIETKPEFVLHVTRMELYPLSTKPVPRPVSCGKFKSKMGRPKILALASFSHQVEHAHSKKNIINVYPRKGEIWALYKNCDSTNEEHDIVEVVEEYGDGEIAKAVALTAKGCNSLYIIQRKNGSDAGFIYIPKAEMSRFSHRIPAVRHEKKTTRLVEGGYWELDPTAIPSRTILLD